ncbi:unnamed protein product [Linum tenue]|uniref:VPS9 domain-containing protein n=1 Tax=Linum tenue TaxID=586396 RepID=A0AAV0JH76_9ROSI|nr:unnamed protein product [Linum tenue]
MENADVFLGLHDFLERMKQPSAADFVKSIKRYSPSERYFHQFPDGLTVNFIVSFSNNAPDPERDSALVQGFFGQMETAFRAHPLWAGCKEEELESAGEGLEKYVMTKLFTRVFASLPDDVKADEQLSEKMSLIQHFVRPENLDIKPSFENETSWLLAQKELQKINMCKAPRDKLVCILNCCKVINHLLLNASIASNENPPGADEFLPVLIYVTMRANPPQLHSNLLYIQRYRRQSRLVGEAAYFFTNMLSAESFISNITPKSISMEEAEYEKNMDLARALVSTGPSAEEVVAQGAGNIVKPESRHQFLKERNSSVRPRTAETRSRTMDAESSKDVVSSLDKVSSMLDIQNRGAALILKEDRANHVFREYPYLYSHVGDLTINDVEELLNSYKQLVFKYVCVCKGLGSGGGGGGASLLSISGDQGSVQNDVEPMKYFQEPETVVEQSNEHGKQNDSLIAESKRLEVEIDPTARKN